MQPEWYNFATQSFDIAGPTDDTATQFLPQNPAAAGLYNCYRELGLDMLEAIINVLSLSIGDPRPFDISPQE